MHDAMMSTATYLINNIQGATFAYTQSDEISILLRDWDTLTTQQWFGGNIQKIVSISASMATVAFNYYLKWWANTSLETANIDFTLYDVPSNLPMFDSRVFCIPKEEVCNYFIWRQQDASRNSVQMLGHWHFSQREMHGLDNTQVQDKLITEKGVNWNDLETWKRRGGCVYKHQVEERSIAGVDDNPPIFTQDRQYVERFLIVSEKQNDM